MHTNVLKHYTKTVKEILTKQLRFLEQNKIAKENDILECSKFL